MIVTIKNNYKTLGSLLRDSLDEFSIRETNETRKDLCSILSHTLMENFIKTNWLIYTNAEEKNMDQNDLSARLFELFSNDDPHESDKVGYVIFYLDKFFATQREASRQLKSTTLIKYDFNSAHQHSFFQKGIESIARALPAISTPASLS